MANKKHVYLFGNGTAEGNAKMKNLLGGKGANLAEMNLIGVAVPPGFTITTEVCTLYNEKGRDAVVATIKDEVTNAITEIENMMGTKFGDKENPLLVSVRSGARASMPGMMDTVLNLGLNNDAVEGIAKKSGNERFAWDSYRRFVQMYGDVVLGMKPEFLAGLFSIFAVISLGATFVAEKLSHKKGIRISLIVVSLIIGISIIAFSLSPYLLLAIIALGIFQVAETMNDILEDSARQHEFSSKIRASLGSLNSINWTISNSIGVFLAGIGISFLGLIHTMIISGVLGIFVVVIYLIGLKK